VVAGLSGRKLEGKRLSEATHAMPGIANAARPIARASDLSGEDALLDLILTSLDDDKAEDVLAISLRGRTQMADHMVIASGRSSRQVMAIAEHLAERVKAATGKGPAMEGRETADWILVDCGDVIVHVFRPEVRAFYQLEKMWMPGSAHRGEARA
jgi:ribosome-associated protein